MGFFWKNTHCPGICVIQKKLGHGLQCRITVCGTRKVVILINQATGGAYITFSNLPSREISSILILIFWTSNLTTLCWECGVGSGSNILLCESYLLLDLKARRVKIWRDI